MGESVGMEGSDFVNSPGAGPAFVVGLAGASLEDEGTVILEWLPTVVVEQDVDGGLRQLAKQK